MNGKACIFSLAILLASDAGADSACEYERGKTKFVDYANCRYGEDSIQVIDLPDSSSWEQCVYFVQPFQPGKLLAVTRQEGGKEILSINDRSQIGNPCYMTKRSCDKALRAWQNGTQ
jgi:hypothetical protein